MWWKIGLGAVWLCCLTACANSAGSSSEFYGEIKGGIEMSRVH